VSPHEIVSEILRRHPPPPRYSIPSNISVASAHRFAATQALLHQAWQLTKMFREMTAYSAEMGDFGDPDRLDELSPDALHQLSLGSTGFAVVAAYLIGHMDEEACQESPCEGGAACDGCQYECGPYS